MQNHSSPRVSEFRLHSPADFSEEFVRRNLRRVFEFILRVVGSSPETQELTQETFIKVFQKKGAATDLRAASQRLLAVAAETAVTWGRKHKAGLSKGLFLMSHEAHPDWADLVFAWVQCSIEERACLLLHDVEGISSRLIARYTHNSAADIQALVGRARVRILAGAPPDPTGDLPGAGHPRRERLALLTTADLPFGQRIRIRRHLRTCQACREDCELLRSQLQKFRNALHTSGTLDPGLVEQEMLGNIAVGLAAARCIDQVGARRQTIQRAVLLALALFVIVSVSWVTRLPEAATSYLATHLRGVAAPYRTNSSAVRFAAQTNSISAEAPSGTLVMSTPGAESVLLSESSQLSVFSTDQETGQILMTGVHSAVVERVTPPAGGEVPFGGVRLAFGNDSPILLQSAQFETPSRLWKSSTPQSTLLLTIKNTGRKTLVGLTFRIDTEQIANAYGSVTIPSMRLRTDGVISVPIALSLSSALGAIRDAPPLVRVSLDSALFDDSSAYGPDSVRSLELLKGFARENLQERKFLSSLLTAGSFPQMREELNFGLPDTPQPFRLEFKRPANLVAQGVRPPLVSLARRGDPIEISNSQVEPSRDGFFVPSLRLRNTSAKRIVGIKLVFLIRDEQANEASVTRVFRSIKMESAAQIRWQEPNAWRVSRRPGAPLLIRGLFVRLGYVEFSDGSVWVPEHAAAQPTAQHSVAPRTFFDSPERQRLTALFRREGMNAVAHDLKDASQ